MPDYNTSTHQARLTRHNATKSWTHSYVQCNSRTQPTEKLTMFYTSILVQLTNRLTELSKDSHSDIHVGLYHVLCERGGITAVGFGEGLTQPFISRYIYELHHQ